MNTFAKIQCKDGLCLFAMGMLGELEFISVGPSVSNALWFLSSCLAKRTAKYSLMYIQIFPTSWQMWLVLHWPYDYGTTGVSLRSWFWFFWMNTQKWLLDYLIVLFLIFWGISIQFSIVAVSFSVSTSSVQGPNFSISLSVVILSICGDSTALYN